MLKNRWRLLASIVLLTAALAGCSDDGGGSDSDVNPSDAGADTRVDAGDADQGDADDADQGDTGDADQGDADAGGEEVGQSCNAPPEDLGTFSPGDSDEFARGYLRRTGQAIATCTPTPDNVGLYWFKFRVDQLAIANLNVVTTISSDPVVEIRYGECGNSEQVLSCDETTFTRHVVEPGQTFYVLVQGPADSVTGDFRLELSFDAATCNPAERTCDSGAMQICDNGSDVQARACAADTCADATTCAGETCSEAVAVDLSAANSTVSVAGGQKSYQNSWNADGLDGCGFAAGEAGAATPGAELFLKVSGQSVGDTIVFDAEGGSVDFGFYLLDACSASSCVAAGAYDTSGSNHFEWTATTDQDVWVAAEVIGPDRDRDFQIDITRQP